MWGTAYVRMWITSMAVMLVITCSSAPPQPTKEHPLPACAISCPSGTGADGGFLFRRQHKCRGDKRWLKDISIIGEYTTRSVDGSQNTAAWLDNLGELYDKRDVVLGPCSMFVHSEINDRDPSKRGQHEGENPDGTPKTRD